MKHVILNSAVGTELLVDRVSTVSGEGGLTEICQRVEMFQRVGRRIAKSWTTNGSESEVERAALTPSVPVLYRFPRSLSGPHKGGRDRPVAAQPHQMRALRTDV